MDVLTAVDGFAAIGSEPRWQVLQQLVKAGTTGMSVGEIQDRTDMPASTLAHHLKHLAQAGLVTTERQGRTIINRADFAHLETLAAFILKECCAESEPIK